MKFRDRARQGNRPVLLGGQSGQSLIEVLVALAILGVVIVAFLTALTTGYLTVVVADEDTRAESLTRTEFERIRNTPYSANVAAFLADAGPYPKFAGSGTNQYRIDVTVPVTLAKSASPTSVSAPGNVTYTYTIHNTGNFTLTGLYITDDHIVGNITPSVTTLAPGASTTGTATYTVTQQMIDNKMTIPTIHNVATVHSTQGATVTASAVVTISQSPKAPASPILVITVTISRQGETLLTTQTYKVDPNKNF